MLIQFTVENFLSFKEENTLNMLATTDNKHKHHLLPNKKKKPLLRTAALYGANGSGKSNLIRAIAFARNLIVDGTRPNQRISVTPFRLDKTCWQAPSRFEFVINYQDTIYTYGFVVDEKEVKEEWLFAIHNVREVPLFERLTTKDGKIKVEISPALVRKKTKKHQFVKFIAEGTRPNSLFLHELYEKNVAKIMPLIDWFRNVLIIIGPDSNYRDLIFDAHLDEHFLKFMGDFLKAADTGVDAIITEKIEFDTDTLFQDLPEPLKTNLADIGANERVLFSTPDGKRFAMMRETNGELTLLKIKTRHHLSNTGEYIDFEIENESDGTRRLMDLIPALLHSKSSEKVYLIDEIDRSMHPLLSRMFLQAYLNNKNCGRGQLIITTHESWLLDRELLRRDEIWFAEKDKNGGSHLYSLAEYKVRKDLKLGKGYLDGRFGAIPFLGNLENLLFNV
ncbi:MAG: ATP/GTP-binding protein [Deltaproteobacteria bacterium]|nr:ATP/GTP-binding protein [Candidatus Tharpella aukensis]